MARLISITYTFTDDNGKVQTIANVDGSQIHAIAASFKQSDVLSHQQYNKQKNNITKNT